jgi:hypothetical protein
VTPRRSEGPTSKSSIDVDEAVAVGYELVDLIEDALVDLVDLNLDDQDTTREAVARAHCLDCGVFVHAINEYYMLHNAVWQEAHPADDGMLCIGCVEERLGRRLTPGDFRLDCPCNDWTRSARFQQRITGEGCEAAA